jgi:hypothetical protein
VNVFSDGRPRDGSDPKWWAMTAFGLTLLVVRHVSEISTIFQKRRWGKKNIISRKACLHDYVMSHARNCAAQPITWDHFILSLSPCKKNSRVRVVSQHSSCSPSRQWSSNFSSSKQSSSDKHLRLHNYFIGFNFVKSTIIFINFFME